MPQLVVPVVPVVVPPPAGRALFALPEAETANHLAPKKFWPWPVTCPRAVVEGTSGCGYIGPIIGVVIK